MKIRLSALKRYLRENLLAEDGPTPTSRQNLGQLLDAMSAQFTEKMQSTYPHAGDVITREASELKTQLTATIKAAAAKVKMAAGGNT